MDEESSTWPCQLKENYKLVSWDMPLNIFIYSYVKIYDTGSFAYEAWIEGSKMDEGAERHSEKGSTFTVFFLWVEKLRLLQSWLRKEKSHTHRNKTFKFCLKKKNEDLDFLNVVRTNIRSYLFHLFLWTISFLVLLRSVLKELFPLCPPIFKYTIYSPHLFFW